MALPPYFTTIVLPWYFISHGSASASVAALSVARFHVVLVGHGRGPQLL